MKPVDPETISLARDGSASPTGKTIYLGNLFQHFGHFVLESLSRMWAVSNLGVAFDVYYFHGWDGLSAQVLLNRDIVTTTFDALGIPIDRVRLVPDTGAWLGDCWVPQQLFEVNRHVHEQFGPMLTAIVDHATRSLSPGDVQSADRIYLSRLHQPRRAENEADIEAIFRSFGFLVVAPEKLPFRQQLALVSQARIVAGCAGSNMHLAAFAQNATVISLDHRLVRNQFILEALRDHTAYHVWAVREHLSPARWIADETVILAALEAVLPQTNI